MSEFSESYQLRSERLDEAVSLLRRAQLKGFVFPPTNGWITVLADGGSFAPDARLVAANEGILLHFVSAEDHGWSFAVFSGNRTAVGYSCSWDEEVEVEKSTYSRAALLKALPHLSVQDVDSIEAKLDPADMDEVFESSPAEAFAQALGLVNYQWLAYDYVARDLGEGSSTHEGVIAVDP